MAGLSSPSPETGLIRKFLIFAHGPARFAAVLTAFVFLLMAVRLVLFPGGPDDDGEMLYYSQSWALAYKTGQPPLYTWIVMAVQTATGPSLGAVALVKYGFLWLFYWFSFLTARRIMGEGIYSVLAPLGLAACWFIGWETAVNYSHTVMVMAAMAATLWLVLRLEDHDDPLDYLALGLAMAAGLSAKFNFVLFLIPLLIAAAVQPRLRPRIIAMPLFLALGGAVLIAGLPLYAGGVLTGGADYARQTGAGAGDFGAALRGLWQFAISSLGLLSPFLVIAVVMFPGAWARGPVADETTFRHGRLLETFLILWVIAAVATIVLSGAADVRNNWLVIWFPAVFYVLLRIQVFAARAEGSAIARRINLFSMILLLIAAAIPAGMAGRAMIAPETCRKCNYFIPYADLAREIRSAGFAGGTIIAQDWPNQLAGNLRRYFPESRAISTRWQDYTPPARGEKGQCLLIWRGDEKAGGEVRAAAKRLGMDTTETAPVQTVSVPLPGASGRELKWSFRILTGRPGC